MDTTFALNAPSKCPQTPAVSCNSVSDEGAPHCKTEYTLRRSY